jgi:hypothetical protein
MDKALTILAAIVLGLVGVSTVLHIWEHYRIWKLSPPHERLS